jgi:hypothetical protein
VAVSLTAVFIAALPALQELARAARSVEKLADTLRRELPPTLEAIRLTGLEISDLTDDVSEGVKSAGQVVQNVDQSISSAKNQARKVQVNTRSVMAGVKAAWKTWTKPSTSRRSIDRLPPSQRTALELRDREFTDPITGRSTASNGYREHEADYQDDDVHEDEVAYQDIRGSSRSPRSYEDLESPEEDQDY